MSNKINTSNPELESRIRSFYQKWAKRGNEKEDTFSFWIDVLQRILGICDATDRINFQKKVFIDGCPKRIDAYIPETKTLIEQKSFDISLAQKCLQSDGVWLTPYEQAKRYNNNLPFSQKARWIIISNFDEFWIYDMESYKPEEEVKKISLSDFFLNPFELGFILNTKSDIILTEEKNPKYFYMPKDKFVDYNSLNESDDLTFSICDGSHEINLELVDKLSLDLKDGFEFSVGVNLAKKFISLYRDNQGKNCDKSNTLSLLQLKILYEMLRKAYVRNDSTSDDNIVTITHKELFETLSKDNRFFNGDISTYFSIIKENLIGLIKNVTFFINIQSQEEFIEEKVRLINRVDLTSQSLTITFNKILFPYAKTFALAILPFIPTIIEDTSDFNFPYSFLLYLLLLNSYREKFDCEEEYELHIVADQLKQCIFMLKKSDCLETIIKKKKTVVTDRFEFMYLVPAIMEINQKSKYLKILKPIYEDVYGNTYNIDSYYSKSVTSDKVPKCLYQISFTADKKIRLTDTEYFDVFVPWAHPPTAQLEEMGISDEPYWDVRREEEGTLFTNPYKIET